MCGESVAPCAGRRGQRGRLPWGARRWMAVSGGASRTSWPVFLTPWPARLIPSQAGLGRDRAPKATHRHGPLAGNFGLDSGPGFCFTVSAGGRGSSLSPWGHRGPDAERRCLLWNDWGPQAAVGRLPIQTGNLGVSERAGWSGQLAGGFLLQRMWRDAVCSSDPVLLHLLLLPGAPAELSSRHLQGLSFRCCLFCPVPLLVPGPHGASAHPAPTLPPDTGHGLLGPAPKRLAWLDTNPKGLAPPLGVTER